jgi:hypothetical protein
VRVGNRDNHRDKSCGKRTPQRDTYRSNADEHRGTASVLSPWSRPEPRLDGLPCGLCPSPSTFCLEKERLPRVWLCDNAKKNARYRRHAKRKTPFFLSKVMESGECELCNRQLIRCTHGRSPTVEIGDLQKCGLCLHEMVKRQSGKRLVEKSPLPRYPPVQGVEP